MFFSVVHKHSKGTIIKKKNRIRSTWIYHISHISHIMLLQTASISCKFVISCLLVQTQLYFPLHCALIYLPFPHSAARSLTALEASACELWLSSCVCYRRLFYSRAPTKRTSKLSIIHKLNLYSCMYRTVVTICTASLTFNNSTFCPHSVFMCFVWISEQTAIISLYSINWLVFIT